MRIYILSWRYYDGSGSGVARTYNTEQRALDTLRLMEEFSNDRQWELTTTIIEEEKENE